MPQIGEGIASWFEWGAPPKPGSLEVTVTERESDEPVAGVEVALQGPTPARAVTGRDGKARFTGLEPGIYWATATQPEFEIEKGKWMAHVGDGDAETMELRIRRILLTVVLKRIDIRPSRLDAGHYWTEIDGNESYGWYPEYFPGWRFAFGVPGRLNGSLDSEKATPTQDDHHGTDAEVMFNPRVLNGNSAAAIKECIRGFARNFRDEWSWPEGPNCQTFQRDIMKHCGLAEEEEGRPVPPSAEREKE